MDVMDDVGGTEERRRLQFAYRQDLDRYLDGLEEYGEGNIWRDRAEDVVYSR